MVPLLPTLPLQFLRIQNFDWLVKEACGWTHNIQQITDTVETELHPAGKFFNPKPLCWKSPNEYTVGGDRGK